MEKRLVWINAVNCEDIDALKRLINQRLLEPTIKSLFQTYDVNKADWELVEDVRAGKMIIPQCQYWTTLTDEQIKQEIF